ncbi:MAG: BrnT family toxin [Pseudomonadales bacterium]|nr:BrnT family toxin [Pseudomonadales bacterium]
MRITYDPEKRLRTLVERGLDFDRCVEVFDGITLEVEDTRFEYDERRTLCVGFLDSRMVMIAYTSRGSTRRIISMRKCNAREVKRYSPYFIQAE